MGNNNKIMSDEGWFMNTVKITQVVLVVVCSVVLLVILSLYCAKTICCVDPVRMELILSTDSTGMVSPQAKQLADSLIYEITKQETILEDKYKYFIEQQSNTQDLLAIGSLILGIIVSLVGFFGISTMKSIEDKARKIGEESANEAFNTKIKELQDKKYKELLEEKFKPEVYKSIKESLNRFEGKKTATINNQEQRLTLLEGSVSGLLIKLNNPSKKSQGAAIEAEKTTPKQEPDIFDNQSK